MAQGNEKSYQAGYNANLSCGVLGLKTVSNHVSMTSRTSPDILTILHRSLTNAI